MDFFDIAKRRRSVRKFKPGKVSDRHVRKILEAGRLAPSGCNMQNREFLVIRAPETIASLSKVQKSFEHVPVVIAVVMEPTATSFGSYWVEDCSACVENMLLAITALGYASVWVQGTLRAYEKKLKKVLGIPEKKRLYVLLPVGHAATKVPKPPRKPLDEIVHYEKYGQKKAK